MIADAKRATSDTVTDLVEKKGMYPEQAGEVLTRAAERQETEDKPFKQLVAEETKKIDPTSHRLRHRAM